MPLAPGTLLEHYEITALLGTGAMGDVYRATDTHLKREVALKILPPEFASDPARLAQFEHDAQILAELNHPNIAAVYGLENANGVRFLVVEFVAGPTLAQRLADGPIPLAESLKIARQVADALEAAHDRGIVHRDLKPANVKLTPEGKAKVLDFGLAASDPSNSSNTPYISPERTGGQTAGQNGALNVDKRADIWSFGALFYEMLTGRRLVHGDSNSSVLRQQPEFHRVPAHLQRLLDSCLENRPARRLHDIADAWRLIDEEELSVRPTVHPAWRVAAVVVTLVFAAAAFAYLRQKPAVKEAMRFEIPAPVNATFANNTGPSVSPDGRWIAFIATGVDRKTVLWIRSLDTGEAHPLPGTESAAAKFWSPDSRSLAFQSEDKLKTIPAAGGAVQTLCDAPVVNGGVWTADNRILFGTAGPLLLVPATGGTPTPLTALDPARHEIQHEGPSMLPDGHHFLYARESLPLEDGGVYIGSLDAKPEQQSPQKLLPDATRAIYVPSPLTRDSPGLLLFVHGVTVSSPDGALMARRFDPKKMEFSGDAAPVADQVYSFGGFSASPTGVLAFGSFSTAGTQSNSQLTWFDRKGVIQSAVGDAGEFDNLALSPDASKAAYRRADDLWVFNFASPNSPARITSGNPTGYPAWSPDGSRILFTSTRGDSFGIFLKAPALSAPEQLLYQSQNPKGVPAWSADGHFVIYNTLGSEGSDLWILPADSSAPDHTPIPYLRTKSNEHNGRFSPDGHWVAYSSNQSGKFEIYVLPFDEANPAAPPTATPRQISKGGGDNAHWTSDGKELLYMAPDDYLMAAALDSSIVTGVSQRLFKKPMGSWDVTADGLRFLIAAPPVAVSTVSRPYHVILNWTQLLKR